MKTKRPPTPPLAVTIKDPVYRARVKVYANLDFELFQHCVASECRKAGLLVDNDYPSDTEGYFIHLAKHLNFVYLRSWGPSCADIATLAHELAHHVFYTLSHVGIKVQAGKSDEAYTYLFDHYFETALMALEKEVARARKRK